MERDGQIYRAHDDCGGVLLLELPGTGERSAFLCLQPSAMSAMLKARARLRRGRSTGRDGLSGKVMKELTPAIHEKSGTAPRRVRVFQGTL